MKNIKLQQILRKNILSWHYISISLALFFVLVSIAYALSSYNAPNNYVTPVQSIRGDSWDINNYSGYNVFVPNNTVPEWDAFQYFCSAGFLSGLTCTPQGAPPPPPPQYHWTKFGIDFGYAFGCNLPYCGDFCFSPGAEEVCYTPLTYIFCLKWNSICQ